MVEVEAAGNVIQMWRRRRDDDAPVRSRVLARLRLSLPLTGDDYPCERPLSRRYDQVMRGNHRAIHLAVLVMATAVLLTGCAVPVASTSGTFSQTNTGSDSYDEYGYDQYGYDENGYDQYGYDASGYDDSGYDEYGYDENGYDDWGYDENGYDDSGYDDWEMGVDGDGYWVECYDGEWSQSGGNPGACSQHGGLG